jgi:hypothetical protein
MKKTTVLMLAVVMVSSCAMAQEFKPAVKTGSNSLNFTFGGFGTFGVGGSGILNGIGVSHFLSSDAALRLGLQVVYNSTKTPYNDPSGNGTLPGADGSTSAFGFGLGVDYLAYMPAFTSRVRPYLGGGVSLTLNSSDVKPAIANNSPNGSLTETKNGNATDGLSFGVAGIIGAEFFLYPEMSLSAEYKLNLLSITSRADRVSSFKGTGDLTTKQGSALQLLGFGAAGATLHIYF